MKLQIANELLKTDPTGVRFLFPPVAIPVDEQGVVSTVYKSNSVQYAVLVYIEDQQIPAILEFNKLVFNGLRGYAQRHDNMEDVEILMSRDDSGEIKMMMGRKSGLTGLSEVKDSLQTIAGTLASKYLDKVGYQTHDFKI